MNKKLIISLFVTALLMLLGLSACNDDTNCASFNTTAIQVDFKNVNTGVTRNLIFREINAHLGEGLSQQLYDSGAYSALSLPLNPFADSSTFLFQRLNLSLIDTLTIGYDVNLKLISPQCGTEYVITGLEIRYHTFDSLTLASTELLTINEADIQIIE